MMNFGDGIMMLGTAKMCAVTVSPDLLKRYAENRVNHRRCSPNPS